MRLRGLTRRASPSSGVELNIVSGHVAGRRPPRGPTREGPATLAKVDRIEGRIHRAPCGGCTSGSRTSRSGAGVRLVRASVRGASTSRTCSSAPPTPLARRHHHRPPPASRQHRVLRGPHPEPARTWGRGAHRSRGGARCPPRIPAAASSSRASPPARRCTCASRTSGWRDPPDRSREHGQRGPRSPAALSPRRRGRPAGERRHRRRRHRRPRRHPRGTRVSAGRARAQRRAPRAARTATFATRPEITVTLNDLAVQRRRLLRPPPEVEATSPSARPCTTRRSATLQQHALVTEDSRGRRRRPAAWPSPRLPEAEPRRARHHRKHPLRTDLSVRRAPPAGRPRETVTRGSRGTLGASPTWTRASRRAREPEDGGWASPGPLEPRVWSSRIPAARRPADRRRAPRTRPARLRVAVAPQPSDS